MRKTLSGVQENMDQDQAKQLVGPDLGLNCLQKLSADNASRYRGFIETYLP